MLDIAGSLCQGSNSQVTFPALPGVLQLIASTPLLQQYMQLETDFTHTLIWQRKVSALHSSSYRQNNDSNSSTLLLLVVAGWPQSLWTLHECLYFRGPLPNP